MMNIQTPSPSTHQTQQQIQPLPQYTAIEQQQEHLKCPRCDSSNTKFCYYNNYNLSQPRHYCKSCRRYWTKGGALRNIPIGGGSRKVTKRSSNPNKKSSVSDSVSVSAPASVSNTVSPGFKPDHSSINGAPVDQDQCSMIDVNGSFSSLLAGFNQHGSGIRTMQFGDFSESFNSGTGLGLDMGRNLELELDLERGNHSESFLGLHSGGDSSCWNNGGGGGDNGWPDLAI